MSSQIMSDNTSVVVKPEIETKPSMCRICLVENVRMHVVADKSLQELYEKLTDIPFAAEDSRPLLACFICYAKLKRCCQLQRQCLQAEELFAHMLNESYELYPAMYRSQLQWCGRFITTPIENISIVDDYRVEKNAIKVEVPAVSETQCEVELIELKEEPICVSDESDKQEDSCQELDDNPPQHSESDSEEDVPLMVMKFEEGEEQLVKQTTRSAIAEEPKLDTWNEKIEDTMNDKQEKMTLPESNSTQNVNLQWHQWHARSNTGEKPYKCDMCQRCFTTKKNVEIHIRTHTGEKPFKCNICQRCFRNRSTFIRHSRTHTGEKPYKCNICQRCFGDGATLRTHTRIHTGEKPYKCDTCQKSFKHQSTLQSHVRIHTGEKPYKCEKCQKSYTRKKILKSHICKIRKKNLK